MIGSSKHYENKTDYVKDFGKFDVGPNWNIEEAEFVNIGPAGDYQTADDTDEDPYPDPIKRLKLAVEKPNANIEETYYWFLQFLRHDLGYPQIDKIYDIFSASENSAVFGNMGQRMAIQQDRAAQYLRGVGELVKQLFQIVRELRIIDEKLEPYKKWKVNKSADISLKHNFIQLVEQGGNNPDSVYSLATKIGFTVLPDLFFGTHVYKLGKIDEEVDHGSVKEFNKVVRTVLKRKLYQYINWKEKSEKELESRRRFQLQYLRQHWTVIQLYMSWVKPYLKNIKRMGHSEGHMDSPDIINAFDATKVEIEILAKKPLRLKSSDGSKDHYKCILAHFSYVTKPHLTYKQEYGQQAVAHKGRCEVTLRAYGWHKEDIEHYKNMRRQQDVEMLKALDVHIQGAFDALGDQFEQYLLESGEEMALERKKALDKKNEESESAKAELDKKRNKFKKFGLLEPFLDIFMGFGELFGGFFASGPKREKKDDTPSTSRDKEKLKSSAVDASKEMGVLYTVYKKSHRNLSW